MLHRRSPPFPKASGFWPRAPARRGRPAAHRATRVDLRGSHCSEDDDQNGVVAFISDALARSLALQVLRRHFRTNLIFPLEETERGAPFSLRSLRLFSIPDIKGAPPKRSVGRRTDGRGEEWRFFAASLRGERLKKKYCPTDSDATDTPPLLRL